MAEGTYGELESTIPPITVPAWMCMMTSRDPGELGIYGFRNRKDYAYDALTIANSPRHKSPNTLGLVRASRKEIDCSGSTTHLSRQAVSGLDGHQLPHA